MSLPFNRTLLLAFAAFTVFATTASADPQAQIVLVNLNAPGVGLNDSTPVAPVGGNTGTTLGQQRQNVLARAASLWARNLKSHATVRIQVVFAARACTATGAVLASAGALAADLNFKHSKLPDTWFHIAVANAVAKTDLDPTGDDLIAIFNINLGNPGCLTGSPFYLGFDHNEGTGVDLLATATHEFAHGLGFSQLGSVSTGTLFLGLPDTYNRNLADLSTGLTWDQMTDAQRVAASINSRKVVWIGPSVTAAVPNVLAFGVPLLNVTSPAAIAGSYDVGAAQFGAPLTSPGITGQVALALDPVDAAGPSSTDACSPITNPGAIAGRIALADRGGCTFVVKVKNLQNAGAIAAIIADNVADSPPAGLGGVDPTITIPSGRITRATGDAIKAQLASGVTATLGLDLTRRAGASAEGFAQINAPNPVVPGSSISHWDPIASPNLIMEPAINPDLTDNLDLTKPLMEDIGWQLDKSQGNGL
jgi:PA domain